MSSVRVEMYTTPWCPYCHLAKRLLDAKGVEYQEIHVDSRPGLRTDVARRSGQLTVPQTFVEGEALGGFDELAALDRAGRLDALLGLDPAAEPAASTGGNEGC